MTDAQMPHDLQTEAQVLGLLLADVDAVLPVMEALAQRHAFYRDAHEDAFNAAWRLWNKGMRVTAATVRVEITDKERGKAIDEAVATVKAWGTNKHDLPAMCQLLLDLKERRDYWFWGQKVIQYATDMKKDMNLLRGLALQIPKTIGVPLDSDPRLDDGIEEMLARIEDTERKGYVKTGLPRLDFLLDGGFAPSTLIVLGARRSTGKTAVGSALAINAMRHRLRVVWVSCEMGRVEVLGRWAAALSGVRLSHRTTKLEPEEQTKLDRATSFLAYSQPILIDNAMSIDELNSSATRWKAQGRLDILVLDYIQIMKMPSGRAMHEQLSKFVMGLKQLAQKLQIPILALAQCRREADPKASQREVRMAHLKGTGGLEETADTVLLVWPAVEERRLECHLAKNRHGPTGMLSLYADFGRMQIRELDDRREG